MSEYVKPEFADKTAWKAYLTLHAVAKERNYHEIGLVYAHDLVGGILGVTNNTTGRISHILSSLAREPYHWIKVQPDALQIIVKPINEVAKNE